MIIKDYLKFYKVLENQEHSKIEGGYEEFEISKETYTKLKKKYKDLSGYRTELLLSFFDQVAEILKKYNIYKVDEYLDNNTQVKHLYNKVKCKNWFLKNRNKSEVFGSYFYFGNENYLLHINFATYNLHVGYVKYKKKNNQYEIIKMNSKDTAHIKKKFGKSSPKTIDFYFRAWGQGWCSVDFGSFIDFSNPDIFFAIVSFEDSLVYRKHFYPIIYRIIEINIGANSAFEYKPSILNLRLSYKCNIFCKHCYNSSNSKEHEIIDVKIVLKVIREAYQCGISTLGITGGEPMLFPDLLYTMISEASRLGYKNINIVTNAYWGKTITQARKAIKSLYDNGFCPPIANLSISAGEFHSEFLDWEHHVNVVRAHHELLGTKIRIDFEHSASKSDMVIDFKKYLIKNGIDESMYKLNVRTSLASVGRWKENEASYDTPYIDIEDLGSCEPTNWFTVDPNGDVFPCCGFNREIKSLVLGNVNNTSVLDIIKSSKSHAPLELLYNMHMHEIYKKLIKHLNLPQEFTSICEACEFFFKDADNLNLLPQNSVGLALLQIPCE